MSVRPSYVCPCVFSFPDDICKWTFTELGVCIGIMEIWFRIAKRHFSSVVYRVICPSHNNSPYFRFRMITLVNVNGFSPNFVCALIFLGSGLRMLTGNFRHFFTVICPQNDNGGVLSFHVLYCNVITTCTGLRKKMFCSFPPPGLLFCFCFLHDVPLSLYVPPLFTIL